MYLLYRALLTPLCFIIFNGGALVLSLIWFHLLNLVVRNPKRRQYYARLSVSLSFRFFIKMLCVLHLIKVRFEHFERLADAGSRPGVILVANHPSLIDYVLIASRLEHINCVVKEALRHNFFLKGIVKATGYLANDDPEAFLQLGSACLTQGEDLLIFPEGTRTSRQREFRLRRGAAALAVHSGHSLQVITITLSTEFLSKEKRWYHVPRTCPEYVLSVGEELRPSEFSALPEESFTAPVSAPPEHSTLEPASSACPHDSVSPGAHDSACAPFRASGRACASTRTGDSGYARTNESTCASDSVSAEDCASTGNCACAEPEALSLRTRRLNRRLTAILKTASNGSFKYGT